jgi:hypothetical protein
MVTEDIIKERLEKLNSDAEAVHSQIQQLDAKRVELVALLNATVGAKQMCESFLKEIYDVDQSLPDQESDVEQTEMNDVELESDGG